MNIEIQKEFAQIPLLAHDLLRNIPIHSLTRLDLPGGRAGMGMLEIKEAGGFDTGRLPTGPVTTLLFWLRGLIGRVLGWDNDDKLVSAVSYLPRLTPEQRVRSLISPGQAEGISRVLYCSNNEFLAEIVNRTVHCFWVMGSKEMDGGYRLYIAVYVRKLNWFTPIYMALVSPLLKWIIYPALYRSVKEAWARSFNPGQTQTVLADRSLV